MMRSLCGVIIEDREILISCFMMMGYDRGIGLGEGRDIAPGKKMRGSKVVEMGEKIQLLVTMLAHNQAYDV
jgi:hypothetical protein